MERRKDDEMGSLTEKLAKQVHTALCFIVPMCFVSMKRCPEIFGLQ